MFDSEGLYQYVSANREKMMGYTPEETYDRHYSDFVAPEYMSHVQLTWADAALTGQSIDSTVLLRTKSGNLARFQTIAWPATDPESNAEYMIVKSRLVAES